MTENSNELQLAARDRIIKVALDLFYNQGYRATGVNEVIEKSKVAKATFYKHFRSKEELGIEYLEQVMANEEFVLHSRVDQLSDPVDRVLEVIAWLKDWAVETNYRGCAFLHMAAEEPDSGSLLRRPGVKLYESIRGVLKKLLAELKSSLPAHYGHLNEEQLSQQLIIIFAGAIALSEVHHSTHPIDEAIETAKSLIRG